MATTLPTTTLERPFGQHELDERLATTRALMGEKGVDLLILTDQDDMFYLTAARELGGVMLAALLVPRDGAPVFVGRAVDALAFEAHAPQAPAVAYRDHESPEQRIAENVASLGYETGTIGVQSGSASLPADSLAELKVSLPQAAWVECTRIVWDQRATKSERELAHMRKVAEINSVALDHTLGRVGPGVTENDISARLFTGMLEAGSHPMTPYIVASGPNTGVVHASFGGRELAAGDHVHFEFSAARFRYHAPLMRTAQLGEPSAAVQRLHHGAEAALEAALATIRAGVTAGEVDAAANAALERLGLREFHYHRTGYSVGIATGAGWTEGHIAALREGDETVLRENMTFHLPMVLFEPGVAGAGLSETVRVTTDGVEVLTSYPRELLRV